MSQELGSHWESHLPFEMGVDIPVAAVSAILDEQVLWNKQRERRNHSDCYQKRNLLKLRANKKHAAEKDHMVTLCAEGCTNAEYESSSGTADTPDSPTDEVDCDEPDDEPVKADTDAAGDDCDPSTDGNDNESQSNILPCSSCMTVSQQVEVHMMTTY